MMDEFARSIVDLYGEPGRAWLEGLPALLEDYATRWSLQEIGPPFTLSYNYVAPAVLRDGTPAVIKAGFPHPSFTCEAEALRHMAGDGMVRVWEADTEHGVLLLERFLPGDPLARLFPDRDEEATVIAAGVMRKIWRPLPAGSDAVSFPTVAEWAAGLDKYRERFGSSGPLPGDLVEKAECLFADLLSSAGEPVLLHGDLHHENILSVGEDEYRAIDPKGVIGEPAYEAGALLRNPMPQLFECPDPVEILARRIAILGDILGLDPVRIRDWATAQVLLSAWWTLEDHGTGWETEITLARRLIAIQL